MKNKLNKTVSFYQNVTDTRPDDANLYDLLTGETYKPQVLAIRKERNSDKQKAMKNKLPLFTPSGIFIRSDAKSILQPTGLICIDVDGKDNDGAENFDRFKELIAAVPYVLYCGLSVRGNGYLCIIPVANPDKHTQYFRSLQADFARCGVVVDKSCSDISRKRFVSYDPEPYINPDASTYDRILEPQRARRTRRDVSKPSSSADVAVEVARIISTICTERIDITGPRGQWFEIICSLVNTFGESARPMVHAVSQFHNDYNVEENDAKVDDALKNEYDYGIGTFFHYAKLHGVDAIIDFREYLKRK